MSPNNSLFPEEESYFALLDGLKQRIRSAQMRATLAVNQELIQLYWQIGREILQRQAQENWGSKMIQKLAKDLKREFPDIKGFSRSNLMYMRSFAESWPDEQIVQRSVGQLPWRHNIALIEKLKDTEERLWYGQQALENGWSRDILVMQIETHLFQRQGGAVTNFEKTLPPEQSDLQRQLLKDPYHFEFLALNKAVQERDLERALVDRIREFLLELGVGFAFVGSQYRLELEGDEFFIDLLFYHIKLHRYVVIDLKTTEFKPEYAGKMNFYVKAVNHLLCGERDDPTIGIVLCRSKKRTIVEFALDMMENPIGVSTYKLRDELPPDLRNSLPSAEQLEMELDAAVRDLQEGEGDDGHPS